MNKIDITNTQKAVEVANKLNEATNDKELHQELHQAMEDLGIKSPWGSGSLDDMMKNGGKLTFSF